MAEKEIEEEEDVYVYGIAHPPAKEIGNTRDFGKEDLESVARRLPGAILRDNHSEFDAGKVLKGWDGWTKKLRLFIMLEW
jgi:hypothetical protein